MSILRYDHALVRTVPQLYARAYAAKGVSIDPVLVRAQHDAYVKALERAGVDVTHVPADEAFYDSVFIEDTAIVWRDAALITRIAEHREGEQRGVADVLRPSHRLSTLSEESRLEGGDVLHTEHVTYVGLTARTNDRGATELASFLEQFGRRVVPVRVSSTLHLKTVATYLGDGTLLVAPGSVDVRQFEGLAILEAAPGEAAGNCVRVRDTILLPDGCPATLDRVRHFADARGVTVVPLDLSEFAKGDGSATCLSLLWQGPAVAADHA